MNSDFLCIASRQTSKKKNNNEKKYALNLTKIFIIGMKSTKTSLAMYH